MRTSKRKPPDKVELNLTSMMDVVFQLIVFFLLVTNFTSNELPELDPPEPDGFVAVDEDRQRIVISVLPDDSGTRMRTIQAGYKQYTPVELDRITAMLKQRKAEQAHTRVDLRADKAIHYRDISRVLGAITAAKIQHVNLVAREPQDG